MATLQELEARQHSIRARLAEIDDIQDPTELDLNEQETLIGEYDQLEPKVADIRKRSAALDRIRRGAENPENVEVPEPGRQAPTMFMRSNLDPFADEERVYRNMVPGDELRARAERLIEIDQKDRIFGGIEGRISGDEQADQAYRRATESPKIARHMLLFGTREYRQAFRSYLETGQAAELESYIKSGSSYRAISLTNTAGGYLLPYVLDATIVLTNNASANPFRRVSRIVQTTSNAWQGVSSAGVTAAWVAEAQLASDNSPTVGQIQITPVKGEAFVFGSYEALDDESFGVQLPGLLADAKDRLESAAFATGSGTAQPLGVISSLGTGSRVAPGTTGTAFQPSTATTGGYWDVLNLQAAVPPRFRNAAGFAFMGNINALNRVRGLDVYGGGPFWTNLSTNTPDALMGKAVYEASDMNATMTGTSAASGTGSATLLAGDFGQFIIADRVGVSMLYDPMLKGTGANAQLPTGQAGWFMFWRVSSAVSTTAAFRYLTIS